MASFVLGLTGGIAAGKSAVSALLSQAGLPIVDADKIAREILVPGREAWRQVVDHFGPDYVDPEGQILRKKLGAYVFSHPQALAALNAITHPAIDREVTAMLAGIPGPAVLDAPLLIETGLCRLCHGIWVVTAPEEVRVERIMARDGLSREQALDRIRAQASDQERAAYATHMIDNSGTRDQLAHRVRTLLAALHEEGKLTGE